MITITLNPAMDKIYYVENAKIGEVFRPKKVIKLAGGKGINVAKVARCLGEEVTAFGFIAGDTGHFIAREIKSLGIESVFYEISGETRTNINITDEEQGKVTEILESGPSVSQEEAEAFLLRYEQLIKPHNIIVMSGSLPKGLPANFYRKLIATANEMDKLVILDTSGEGLKEGMKEKPYCVKPNRDEIKQLFGCDTDDQGELVKALYKMNEDGIKLPIISLGEEGSLALIEGNCYLFEPPKVEFKSTVGCGDSFIAGLAVMLKRKKGLLYSLKTANACGAVNAMFEATGFVTKDLVSYYSSKIDIKTPVLNS